MSPGSSTESYPALAHIGLRENPGKNLNQVTCPNRESNPGHLVSRPDALAITPQDARTCKLVSKSETEVTGGQEDRKEARRTGNMCPGVELTDEGMYGLCLRVLIIDIDVHPRDTFHIRLSWQPRARKGVVGNDDDDRRPLHISAPQRRPTVADMAPQRGPTATYIGASTKADRRIFWRPNVGLEMATMTTAGIDARADSRRRVNAADGNNDRSGDRRESRQPTQC
ncbi:hypothetical protein ANN_15599 [Periplaneta americana]|uniref:Uncharacterized protein n=1 Tax=Periplaneta americana TaxID=6978 RepID=A0ABQ8SHT5_PERAM|nr:hypothetical protein ANN_15599 [Periplaneta americana]